MYVCPRFAFVDAFLCANACTCVRSQTLVKSRSKQALIIFYLCCMYSTVALQQLLQSYFCLFFPPKKMFVSWYFETKMLCFFSGRQSDDQQACWHLKRIHFHFFEEIHLGIVWHYILIHNRYSKMRNFCTTIATSVSEDQHGQQEWAVCVILIAVYFK